MELVSVPPVSQAKLALTTSMNVARLPERNHVSTGESVLTKLHIISATAHKDFEVTDARSRWICVLTIHAKTDPSVSIIALTIPVNVKPDGTGRGADTILMNVPTALAKTMPPVMISQTTTGVTVEIQASRAKIAR